MGVVLRPRLLHPTPDSDIRRGRRWPRGNGLRASRRHCGRSRSTWRLGTPRWGLASPLASSRLVRCGEPGRIGSIGAEPHTVEAAGLPGPGARRASSTAALGPRGRLCSRPSPKSTPEHEPGPPRRVDTWRHAAAVWLHQLRGRGGRHDQCGTGVRPTRLVVWSAHSMPTR